jgi:hypothetical protein
MMPTAMLISACDCRAAVRRPGASSEEATLRASFTASELGGVFLDDAGCVLREDFRQIRVEGQSCSGCAGLTKGTDCNDRLACVSGLRK